MKKIFTFFLLLMLSVVAMAADLKTSVTYKGTWADIENAYTPVEGEIRLLSVAVRAATSSRTLSTSTSSS